MAAVVGRWYVGSVTAGGRSCQVAGVPGGAWDAVEETTGSEFSIVRKHLAVGRNSGRRKAGCPRVCRRWFIALYSDYRDDRLDADARADVIAHMAECASCRRYDRVIRTGVAVLRDSVGSEEDVGACRSVSRRSEPVASGIAVASTLLVIALNGASAWAPVLAPGPREVEIPPVVAAEPSPPAVPASFPMMPALLRVPLVGPEPGDPGGEVAPPRIQVSVAAPVDPD